MREQVVVARFLPLEIVSHISGGNRKQQQVILSGKVLRHRFDDLIRRRKVNEAVLDVDRRAGKFASRLRGGPNILVDNFVDRRLHFWILK